MRRPKPANDLAGKSSRRSYRWRLVETIEELEDRTVLTLLGQQLFPSDNPWNQDIANAPVAANSSAVINNIVSLYGNGNVHPDFAQDTQSSGPLYGIPYNVVHGNTQPQVQVVIDGYPDESDLEPAPIPPNAVLEGDMQDGPTTDPADRGDSHLIVWDEDNNIVYEFFAATRPSENNDGQWHAASEAVWNLNTDDFRTIGDGSADAAGLPILPGLVRPDEALPISQGGQGAIDHAIRFTLENNLVLDQFVYPAEHTANPGNTDAAVQVPMGTRFRLKADVDISQLDPESRVIAQAMKTYGLILADNGSNFFISGASYSVDANNNETLTWNNNDILDHANGLESLTFSDFEVVDTTPVVTGLSASSGSAGSTITIDGQNFSGAAGQLQVFFGSTPATDVTVISDSQVSAVVPNGSGTVNVTVQSGVTTPSDPENYNNPVFGYGTSAITQGDEFTYGGSTTSASFLGTDTTTQGSWVGVYGQDGYDLPWYPYVVTPAYAQVALSGESTYTYTTATTDPRAVEYPNGSGRMATVWAGNSFGINVDLTDGQAHRVTLYALDWGGGVARSERIEVIDTATGAVLDTRTVSSFQNGVYLSWELTGSVTIQVTNLVPGSNAVLSGLFLG
jgi:hypothetical protein